MSGDPNHAVLLNSIYRHQRHIYDFTRKYYLFGRDRLIGMIRPSADACILEIGCGTARNLIKMAKYYPGRHFFGLDASGVMLETAEQAIEQAGLSSQISLAHAYAEDLGPLTFGRDIVFDDIVFSYSLSMIPDWRQALNAASAVLSPRGRIHVVDFGDLAGMPRPVKWALFTWLKHFHVEPRVELMRELEQDSKKHDKFHILMGRYAFILVSHRRNIRAANERVASGSQGMDKTRLTAF